MQRTQAENEAAKKLRELTRKGQNAEGTEVGREWGEAQAMARKAELEVAGEAGGRREEDADAV